MEIDEKTGWIKLKNQKDIYEFLSYQPLISFRDSHKWMYCNYGESIPEKLFEEEVYGGRK